MTKPIISIPDAKLAVVRRTTLDTLLHMVSGGFDVDDDLPRCVLPGCLVRSRRLDRNGMCPVALWDDHHARHATALADELPDWMSR